MTLDNQPHGRDISIGIYQQLTRNRNTVKQPL